jgi:hypothetical protein
MADKAQSILPVIAQQHTLPRWEAAPRRLLPFKNHQTVMHFRRGLEESGLR